MVNEALGFNKLAFMFPGVGSQYSGMGKALHDSFKVVQETFEEAGDTLGIDFRELCFNKSEQKKLNLLEFSKPALVCLSVATHRVFKQEVDISPHCCIGYSLGEYSALCCAGAISFSDTLKIVQQRALIVNEVSSKTDGTMAWVINIKNEIVEEICSNARAQGNKIYISAYDNEEKVSVSGTYNAIGIIAKEIEDIGGMVIPIKMSGPYHSIMMNEAAIRLKEVLLGYEIKNPYTTVIANRNALPYKKTKESIIENLSSQIIEPINWRGTILYLLNQGVNIALEIGPKSVLKYILEMNTKKIKSHAIDEFKDMSIIKDKFLVNSQDYSSIIKRCLGSIVSTKNCNADEEEYYEKVVKPYREIEKIHQMDVSQKKYISSEDLYHAIELLYSILKVKKLKESEINHQLSKVLNYKILV